MILSKIEEVRNSLTKSEKKLVMFIENNSHKVKNYNVMELSDKSGVSAPSIIRFVKKIGYSGFFEMRMALNRHFNQNIRIERKYESVMELYKTSLENTMDFMDEKILENLLEIIKESKKIIITGVEGSEEIARDFYKSLLKKGKNIYFDKEVEVLKEIVINFSEEDIIILFCHFGENKKLIELIDKADMNGSVVVSITKAEKNSIGKKSDINIITDNTEKAFKINQRLIADIIIENIDL
ncbi:MAG: MurR/RpiR family transcriptional regulator [Fusobacteriaceae bacterium]